MHYTKKHEMIAIIKSHKKDSKIKLQQASKKWGTDWADE